MKEREREGKKGKRDCGNCAHFSILVANPLKDSVHHCQKKGSEHLVIRTSMALRTCCLAGVLRVNLDAASHAPVQLHTCKQYKRIIKTDEPVFLEGSLPCTLFASSIFFQKERKAKESREEQSSSRACLS